MHHLAGFYWSEIDTAEPRMTLWCQFPYRSIWHCSPTNEIARNLYLCWHLTLNLHLLKNSFVRPLYRTYCWSNPRWYIKAISFAKTAVYVVVVAEEATGRRYSLDFLTNRSVEFAVNFKCVLLNSADLVEMSTAAWSVVFFSCRSNDKSKTKLFLAQRVYRIYVNRNNRSRFLRNLLWSEGNY